MAVDRAQITYSPHPLLPAQGRQLINLPLMPGENLFDYLVRAEINTSLPLAVALNGTQIAREQWAATLPGPGDLITARAVVQDGEGSDVTRVLLTLAVMYVAGPGGAGAALGAATGVGTAVGTMMVTMAGTYIANELVPARQPDLSNAANDTAPSATYSVSNGRNRARPGEPCLLVLGRHRVRGDLLGKPYTDYWNHSQRLYQVFDFGVGDSLALSDFQLGETPLSDYDSTPGAVDLHVSRQGSSYGASDASWGNVDTESVGSVTDPGGAHTEVIRTTSADTVRIGVDLVVQSYIISNSGVDKLRCEIDVQYREVGDSTWITLVTDTDAVVAPGYWSYGEEIQADKGVLGGWNQYDYSGNALNDPPGPTSGGVYWAWIAGTTAVSASWRWPHPYMYLHPQVDYLLLGDSDYKPAEPRRRSMAKDVPAGQYEVRVFQRTAASGSMQVQSVSWVALKSFREDTGDYSDRTRVSLRLEANGQVQGVVDELSAMAEQWIPVRQDNGSWSDGPSTNPAWQYLWLARGKRDGSGQRLFGAGMSDGQIDLPAIYDWADFCHDNSLSCSLVFDHLMSIGDMLRIVAQCGRGAPSWASGKLGVIWDEPNTPITQVFNPANIIPGTFRVEYIGGRLPSEVIGTYVDAAAGYKRREVRVAVTGADPAADPLRIELIGVDNEDQARRDCNLAAAGQRFRRRRISWDADVEGLQASRGDVLSVAHDIIGWGQGRRVASGDTNDLALTGDVEFGSGTHYVTVRHGDGTIQTKQVESRPSGTITRDIGLTSHLSQTPDMDCVVTFGSDSEPGKRVKLLDYKPKGEHRITLIATDEAPEYYAAESNPLIGSPPPDYNVPRPAVLGVEIGEELVSAAGATRVTVTPNIVHADAWHLEVRMVSGAAGWIDRGIQSGESWSGNYTTGNDLQFRITPMMRFGMRRGGSHTTATHVVQGLLAPPPTPSDIVVESLVGGDRRWSVSMPELPADLAGYRLKFSATQSTDWATMTWVHDANVLVSAISQHTAPQAAGTYTVACAAVDQGGRESLPRIETITFTADGGVIETGINTHQSASNSAPSGPAAGDLWYQTDTGLVLRWSGAAWSYISGGLVGNNMVPDARFVDPTGAAWTGGSQVTRLPTGGEGGAPSMRLDANSGWDAVLESVHTSEEARAGQRYQIGARFAVGEAFDVSGAYLFARWLDAAGSDLGIASVHFLPTGVSAVWGDSWSNITAPSDDRIVGVRFGMAVHTNNSAGWVHATHVWLDRVVGTDDIDPGAVGHVSTVSGAGPWHAKSLWVDSGGFDPDEPAVSPIMLSVVVPVDAATSIVSITGGARVRHTASSGFDTPPTMTLLRNGSSIGEVASLPVSDTASSHFPFSGNIRDTPGPGTHTYELQAVQPLHSPFVVSNSYWIDATLSVTVIDR